MASKEKIEAALSRFIFSSGIGWNFLPLQDQELLASEATKIKLTKKKVLYRRGSYAGGVYLLQKGKLKVFQLNYDGSVQILFIYGSNEVFGYRAILSNEYHPVTVAALEDCELLFIEREKFLKFLQQSTALSNQLLFSLSHEFTVLTNRMNVFAQRGIKERLALSLLILNETFRKPGDINNASEIILSRTDLANFVGTSLENLVRTIRFFKEKRLIRTKGKSIFIEHYENLFILSSID